MTGPLWPNSLSFARNASLLDFDTTALCTPGVVSGSAIPHHECNTHVPSSFDINTRKRKRSGLASSAELDTSCSNTSTSSGGGWQLLSGVERAGSHRTARRAGKEERGGCSTTEGLDGSTREGWVWIGDRGGESLAGAPKEKLVAGWLHGTNTLYDTAAQRKKLWGEQHATSNRALQLAGEKIPFQ